VEVCQFHALAQIGKKILVFPQLCHGCGSCTWNCPEGAISEVPNPVGVLETGPTSQGIPFWRGLLTISEPMATPIIRQLKKTVPMPEEMITILDAPPGASCSVVETLRGADYAVLVTEPTPFGLHDLKQMVGIVKDMSIPAGVVINRQNGEFPPLEAYCVEQGLPILMRIPFERTIAAGIASGKTLVDIYPHYRESFLHLIEQVELARKEKPGLAMRGEG
jgi:MinD superfamily P-loop ATPase